MLNERLKGKILGQEKEWNEFGVCAFFLFACGNLSVYVYST